MAAQPMPDIQLLLHVYRILFDIATWSVMITVVATTGVWLVNQGFASLRYVVARSTELVGSGRHVVAARVRTDVSAARRRHDWRRAIRFAVGWPARLRRAIAIDLQRLRHGLVRLPSRVVRRARSLPTDIASRLRKQVRRYEAPGRLPRDEARLMVWRGLSLLCLLIGGSFCLLADVLVLSVTDGGASADVGWVIALGICGAVIALCYLGFTLCNRRFKAIASNAAA